MDGEKQVADLLCSFCGEMNKFTVDDLYSKTNAKKSLKEKYCLECGEPITIECPNCNKVFVLNDVIKKQKELNVLKSFWNPTASPLDQLIPELTERIESYTNLAKSLSIEAFRRNQAKFLEKIPELEDQLKSLKMLSNNIIKIDSSRNLDKLYKKLVKNVENSIEETKSIQQAIIPDKNLVDEKKEKQLRKRNPFTDFLDLLIEFLKLIRSIREDEIKKEQDTLRPGLKKVKNHIKEDPVFYSVVCPICNTKIYGINHQIYIIGTKDKKLKFIKNLAQFYRENKKNISSSKTVNLLVSIHIEKEEILDFNGDLTILLRNGEKTTIGRDLIREIEYQEIESEEILYDETNPLGRISNSQFTLEKDDNIISIQGMDYDERRVGTYLNSYEYDIRIKDPDGIILNSGDKILIPLTNESNTPNRVEIVFK